VPFCGFSGELGGAGQEPYERFYSLALQPIRKTPTPLRHHYSRSSMSQPSRLRQRWTTSPTSLAPGPSATDGPAARHRAEWPRRRSRPWDSTTSTSSSSNLQRGLVADIPGGSPSPRTTYNGKTSTVTVAQDRRGSPPATPDPGTIITPATRRWARSPTCRTDQDLRGKRLDSFVKDINGTLALKAS